MPESAQWYKNRLSKTPLPPKIPKAAIGAKAVVAKEARPMAVVKLVITTAIPEWPRAWTMAVRLSSPCPISLKTRDKIWTAAPTPTARRKEGRIMLGNVKGTFEQAHEPERRKE